SSRNSASRDFSSNRQEARSPAQRDQERDSYGYSSQQSKRLKEDSSQPALRLRHPRRDQQQAQQAGGTDTSVSSKGIERLRASSSPYRLRESDPGVHSHNASRAATSARMRSGTRMWSDSEVRTITSSNLSSGAVGRCDEQDKDAHAQDSKESRDHRGRKTERLTSVLLTMQALRSGRGKQSRGGTNSDSGSDDEPRIKTREQRDAERQDAHRRHQDRVRFIRKIGFGIVGTIVLGLIILVGFIIADSQFVAVNTIQVQGSRFLSDDEVQRNAAIRIGEPMLMLNVADAEERLADNPWIVQADISRQFPSTVTIELSERVPAVSVLHEDDLWVASSDGRWLGIHVPPPRNYVVDPTEVFEPVDIGEVNIIRVEDVFDIEPQWGETVQSETLLNTLSLLRGLDSQIISRVHRVVAPEVGRTSLFTIDGVELDVGRADHLQEKSEIILAILEEYADDVILINVRSINNPTWRRLSR
ncbi:MAG: FtsQ-type POTRA domain-containing protein, partial [Coriobacteriia bacterium]|nr:FtsQ-type POTRA domain-containing protein [Coriobacteriia bacterium]